MSDSTRFAKIKFEVEVSARYHEYRRAVLETRVTFIRLVSLLGSVLALLAVSNWVESQQLTVFCVTIVSVIVGIFNLVDLVFHFDDGARVHMGLYQRFKALQAEMARGQAEADELTPKWEAEAQSIRIDEPPTYWATYALAWNQTTEKYLLKGHERPLTRWQRFAAG